MNEIQDIGVGKDPKPIHWLSNASLQKQKSSEKPSTENKKKPAEIDDYEDDFLRESGSGDFDFDIPTKVPSW